jgi:phage terminase Nu1 subunit (DNA packaging protein)
MASLAQTAAHLDLGERRFREFVTSGVIPKGEGLELYNLDTARVAYIRYLREGAAGRLSTGELDPPQERARKDKELADKTALQNAVLRNELLSVDTVRKFMVSAFSRVRLKLLALPSKLAPVVIHLETTAEVQTKLSDGIHDALEELAGTIVEGVADDGAAGDDSGGAGMVAGIEAATGSNRKPVGRPRAATVSRG